GIGTSRAASVTISSAYPPHGMSAMTRSPTFTLVTPSPTAATSPATSPPGVNGGSGLNWYLPAMISVSGKLTPHARTRTTACPAEARGDGSSSTTNCSGSPNVLQTTALMVGTISVRQGLAKILRPTVFARQVQVDDQPARRLRVAVLERLDAHHRAVTLPRRHRREVERVLAEQLHLL